MRTLCVACHYYVTKAYCVDRCIARVKAKKLLKAVMNALKNVQDAEKTNTHLNVCSESTVLLIYVVYGFFF